MGKGGVEAPERGTEHMLLKAAGKAAGSGGVEVEHGVGEKKTREQDKLCLEMAAVL